MSARNILHISISFAHVCKIEYNWHVAWVFVTRRAMLGFIQAAWSPDFFDILWHFETDATPNDTNKYSQKGSQKRVTDVSEEARTDFYDFRLPRSTLSGYGTGSVASQCSKGVPVGGWVVHWRGISALARQVRGNTTCFQLLISEQSYLNNF